MPRPFPGRAFGYWRFVALCGAVLFSAFARAEQTSTLSPSAESAHPNPWAFNLTLYTWLAGVNGDFSVGPYSRSVDASFIDISNRSRRFPLGFMGRLEAHYDRLGFYLDGNYVNLQFKPRFVQLSQGIDSELGLMDYGVMYRILGPSAAEMPASLGKRNSNWLAVYAGGRTIWLDNSVELMGPRGGQISLSASKSFTSPVIGGRFLASLTPHWFVLVDGNVGGFGVQNVSFTGAVSGALGYRTTVFDIPTSFEIGYRVLRYNVDSKGSLQTNATLNGPFVGVTGYW